MKQTPKTHIVRHLRLLWLHSKERAEALKLGKYSCSDCGIKQSKKKGHEQKVQVHHKEGVGNWDKVITSIRKEILCSSEKLEVLCPSCHLKKDREDDGS